MATDPAFASTPTAGTPQILTAVETSLTVPTQAKLIYTAGTSGTEIQEIIVSAVTTSLTPTTVAGLVYIFLYDGATYHLFDTFTLNANTASATAAPLRLSRIYSESIPSGYSVYASNSVSGNNNLIKVICLGSNY